MGRCFGFNECDYDVGYENSRPLSKSTSGCEVTSNISLAYPLVKLQEAIGMLEENWENKLEEIVGK
tara:strand:+ start:195 stop:392 length:198 start_codon:yes stop_codon:yes gene_type:complete